MLNLWIALGEQLVVPRQPVPYYLFAESAPVIEPRTDCTNARIGVLTFLDARSSRVPKPDVESIRAPYSRQWARSIRLVAIIERCVCPHTLR